MERKPRQLRKMSNGSDKVLLALLIRADCRLRSDAFSLVQNFLELCADILREEKRKKEKKKKRKKRKKTTRNIEIVLRRTLFI